MIHVAVQQPASAACQRQCGEHTGENRADDSADAVYSKHIQRVVNALITTNTSAAAAAITWLFLSWQYHKKTSVIGAAVGAVAGLVGITPAAGFVTPLGAMAIGVITSACCYFVTEFVVRGRVVDSLDVFGVHGVNGTG